MGEEHYLDNDTQTLSQFNDMILKAQEVFSSTPTLIKEKTGNNLRQLYLDATKNYITGPEQIDQTFKNYFVYEKGEQAYNEEQEKILAKRAQIISNQFLQNFKANIANTLSNLKTYTSLLVNDQNVKDYYQQLSTENPLLNNKLKTKNADIITKDRKSFYEDQGIDNLKFYYTVFYYLYLFLILLFFICIFLVPTSFSKGTLFIFFLFLILYLFLGEPILAFVFGLGKKGWDLLPKNIYKSI